MTRQSPPWLNKAIELYMQPAAPAICGASAQWPSVSNVAFALAYCRDASGGPWAPLRRQVRCALKRAASARPDLAARLQLEIAR